MIGESQSAMELFLKLYALPTAAIAGAGVFIMNSHRIYENIKELFSNTFNQRKNQTERVTLSGEEYMFNVEIRPVTYREKIRRRNLQKALVA